MATGGAKKSVRKKRFAYYVGFRTWSDDATAHLPLSFSGTVGRGVAGRTTKFCGGFCTSPASADRFQHLNARRRREREREREEEEEESERAISPIFRFLGKKWPPFHSIARPSSLRSFCCVTAAAKLHHSSHVGETTDGRHVRTSENPHWAREGYEFVGGRWRQQK